MISGGSGASSLTRFRNGRSSPPTLISGWTTAPQVKHTPYRLCWLGAAIFVCPHAEQYGGWPGSGRELVVLVKFSVIFVLVFQVEFLAELELLSMRAKL
jgi:hypothetical protein